VGCHRAIHAEANAVRYVPEQFLRAPKVMYTTESPCAACAALIQHARFTHVYYLHEYRLDAGIKILLRSDIKVVRMTPSGYLLHKEIQDNTLRETMHLREKVKA
jgi:deoxycytidylate deaminase